LQKKFEINVEKKVSGSKTDYDEYINLMKEMKETYDDVDLN